MDNDQFGSVERFNTTISVEPLAPPVYNYLRCAIEPDLS